MEKNLQYQFIQAINGDKLSRNIIINHFTDYINNLIVKNYNTNKFNRDELLNIGVIAVLEFLDKCSKENSKVLYTDIYLIIKRQINRFVNNENDLRKRFEHFEQENNIDIKNLDLFYSIEPIIKKLAKNDQEIVYLYYLENYTLEDLSTKYNLTRKEIRINLARILRTIRKMWANENSKYLIKKNSKIKK